MLTSLLLLLALAPDATPLPAVTNTFIGKWKLIPEKSTMHDQMKVTAVGPNRYAFDFGGGRELITADGSDQPGLEGSTLAVTPEAPHIWRVVRKAGGRTEISAIWTLSPDGKSLRDDFTGFPPNGSSYTIHYIYTPIGTASGFAATWDSTNEKPGHSELEVQPYQKSGLSFVSALQHSTKNMLFDGRDRPVSAKASATCSARRPNPGTIDFTEKKNGKVVDTQHIQLSPDGTTMTITIQPANRLKPDILIYERE
jgi:hypothetical protein